MGAGEKSKWPILLSYDYVLDEWLKRLHLLSHDHHPVPHRSIIRTERGEAAVRAI